MEGRGATEQGRLFSLKRVSYAMNMYFTNTMPLDPGLDPIKTSTESHLIAVLQ